MRLVLAAICLTLCLAFQPPAARADLEVGQRFPNLTFSRALSAADRAYLGLIRPGPFTLKDITGTPTYVVLDRQGRVVFVHAGEIGRPRQFLRKILSHLEL